MQLRRLLTPVVLVAALAGCGDDRAGGAAATPVDAAQVDGDILDRLRALPEVASVVEASTQTPGYRYFRLEFDQPVDHDHPDGAHFQQYATLIHRDARAPMVMLHTGYGNWYADSPHQLTWLLQANQVVVEHRFFRGSRPTGGPDDWQFLTIRQAAADHHRITQALRRIYAGAWLETGASKGGMTSIYHRRFYPDDVDGTVAYVAPISFAAPDYRYDAYLAGIGPIDCHQLIETLQVEMLANRRAMLEQRARDQATMAGYAYTRVALAPAVESAVTDLEWSFWQYIGAGACSTVPPTNASDQDVWNFLERVSPVSGSSDDEIAEFEAYYYQADAELGYPGTANAHLDGLTMFDDAAFAGAYPVGVARPTYQPAAMTDVDTWVRTAGDRLLFLYGEWDPWSGGMFALGEARASMRVVATQGSHGSDLKDLATADRDASYADLAAWTGVTPDPGRLFRQAPAPLPPPEPHLPPAIRRGLQLRHR